MWTEWIKDQMCASQQYQNPLRILVEKKWPRLTMSSACVAYQGEALGWRCPPLHSGKWPLLDHIFGPLVHSHHRLFGDPQEPRHQLVLALHLFLQKKTKKKKTHQLYLIPPNFTNRTKTLPLSRKRQTNTESNWTTDWNFVTHNSPESWISYLLKIF